MNKKTGFTFMEIIIAISIMMALAAIAIPSFKDRKAKSQIDAAVQVGLKDAQFLQKWFTIKGYYSKSATGSGCPNLPFRFYPETVTNEKNPNYKIPVESMVYFSTSKNGCQYGNKFMIIGQPICDTIVAKMGNICIDQDGNVATGRSIACDASGFDPAKDGCIEREKIPDEGGNTPSDDNESGEVNPDDPSDDIPDPSFCEANPNSDNCKTIAFCSKYENLNQPQCKCVLDYTTNPACSTPDEANCTGEALNYPECACSVTKVNRPDWCGAVDCKKVPEAPACEDECKGPNPGAFCTCWSDPQGAKCKEDCLGQYVAKWCSKKDYCDAHPTADMCTTKDYCAEMKYVPTICKCEGATLPDWCKNITPADEEFCKLNPGNPMCKPKDFKEGDIDIDACKNSYVCIKADLCNSINTEKYTAGTGTDWTDAWKVDKCANGSEPNYPPSDGKGYAKGDVIVTNSCETYIASEDISAEQVAEADIQPGKRNEKDKYISPWTPHYAACHASGENAYRAGDVVYDPVTGKNHECIDVIKCNQCNVDGSDKDKEDCIKNNGWTL